MERTKMNPRSIAVLRGYAVAVAASASLLASCGGSDDDNNTYRGMNLRTSNVQGGILGGKVGEWVAKNYFRLRD